MLFDANVLCNGEYYSLVLRTEILGKNLDTFHCRGQQFVGWAAYSL